MVQGLLTAASSRRARVGRPVPIRWSQWVFVVLLFSVAAGAALLHGRSVSERNPEKVNATQQLVGSHPATDDQKPAKGAGAVEVASEGGRDAAEARADSGSTEAGARPRGGEPVAQAIFKDVTHLDGSADARPTMKQNTRKTTVRPGRTGLDLAAGGILHITNDGDRVVVSDASHRVILVSDGSTGSSDDNALSAVAAPDAQPEGAQGDYDDIYPGCPRTLPGDSSQAMIDERAQLYGCRYLQSCLAATDEAPAVCTWDLVGKQ